MGTNKISTSFRRSIQESYYVLLNCYSLSHYQTHYKITCISHITSLICCIIGPLCHIVRLFLSYSSFTMPHCQITFTTLLDDFDTLLEKFAMLLNALKYCRHSYFSSFFFFISSWFSNPQKKSIILTFPNSMASLSSCSSFSSSLPKPSVFLLF